MTALSLNQIPSDINTLERLHAWCSLTLGFINPTKAIVESAGENPEAVCQTFTLRADDGKELLVTRTSLPLDPDWRANSIEPFWNLVTDLVDVDIPEAYTQQANETPTA